MRERRAILLRAACFIFAILLTLQAARLVLRAKMDQSLLVPAVPSLPQASTNIAGATTNTPVASSKTNQVASLTNTPVASSLGTNSTNIARAALLDTTSTNALVITTETNSTALTNLTSASGKTLTNTITAGVSAKGGTNTSARASTGTNSTNILVLVALPDQPGTNKTVAENSGKTNATSKPDGTNTVAAKGGPGSPTNSAGPRSMARMGGFPGGPPGMGAKPPDLPPLPKARVDRIVQSEILAQVMRPMPMALLGIAGQHAFLRSANGQTGIVKEGDEIGGLKLLRIGTNRVLVESEGQKKELMIFAGFGGDSLVPKPEKTTNEPSKK